MRKPVPPDSGRVCKDCVAEGNTGTRRPTPYPGPRCTTHHRAEKARRSKAAHGKRVESTYGITESEYWELYEFQEGRCFICRRAYGKRKRLAVDHDHDCDQGHDPKVGCRKCVRGLCCVTCNRIVLGRYSEEDLVRAIWYLKEPPAQRLWSGNDSEAHNT